MSYPHIAQQIFNTPLMYEPSKAEALLNGLGSRIAGGAVHIANAAGAADHIAFGNGRPSASTVNSPIARQLAKSGRYPFDVHDGVAVIPIEGSLVQKGAWIGSYSGATSYEGMLSQIHVARRAEGVKGVVFEVDSFGGQVNGCFETAAAIRALSIEKPTISILTDYAYSAGYMLASQARQIVMPEFGGAGSIGVIIVHEDRSQKLQNEGVAVTIIRAGKHKAEANSYEPLVARQLERWQREAETMRRKFAEVVALGRGTRFSAGKALGTEADTYTAQESVALGLVDTVADPVETFEAFVRGVNRR